MSILIDDSSRSLPHDFFPTPENLSGSGFEIAGGIGEIFSVSGGGIMGFGKNNAILWSGYKYGFGVGVPSPLPADFSIMATKSGFWTPSNYHIQQSAWKTRWINRKGTSHYLHTFTPIKYGDDNWKPLNTD